MERANAYDAQLLSFMGGSKAGDSVPGTVTNGVISCWPHATAVPREDKSSKSSLIIYFI